MPINKTGGVIVVTPAKSLNTPDGQLSGASRASDFAVVDTSDVTKQLQINLSEADPGTTIVMKAPAGASGTIEVSFPVTSGPSVAGPGSSTDDAVPLFDGETGGLLKNSNLLVDNGGVESIAKLNDDGGLIQVGTTSTPHGAYFGEGNPMLAAATSAAAGSTGPILVLSASDSEAYAQVFGPDFALGTSTRGGRTAGEVQLWSNDLECATAKPDGTFEVTLGASGSFTSQDGKTITVVKGIITDITGP